MLRNHSTTHKHQAMRVKPKPIRPVRVAARRQREMMVIIANEENVEHAEWCNEENVELDGLSFPGKSIPVQPVPVCTMADHFASPWENAS